MILDDLAAYAKERVEMARTRVSLEEMRETALALTKGSYCFEAALKRDGISFICEIKKASPSRGVISEDFPYLKIAEEYEDAGADCISCLTEPKWFMGSDEVFREVRDAVSVPMLRKDFMADEYQLYEAKCLGADAVLLICALLDTGKIARYIEICGEMGICALVEAHDEREIKSAVSAGAGIIGVNNRNLKDFSVDFSNAARLRDKIPDSVLFVCESGVRSPDDISVLKTVGADAVLIGETLMRAENKRALLGTFRRMAK